MTFKHRKMWFGTEGHMEWIPVPLTGADVSPIGWSANAIGLGGEGFQRSSYGSHREYKFAWSNASSRAMAQSLQDYSNGSYGRGPIYFVDPHTYKTNVFPAHWADPSMALGFESWPLVSDLIPKAVSTPNNSVGLPVRSAQYTLTNTSHNVNGTGNDTDLFLPIPEGMSLLFGAWYASTGSTGIYYQTTNSSGGTSAWIRVTPQSFDSFLPQAVSGQGVRFKIGTTSGSGSVTLSGMRAILLDSSTLPSPITYNWTGTADASTSEMVQNGATIRTNLITNPSFETGLSDWGSTSGSAFIQSQDWSSDRSSSAKFTAEVSGSGILGDVRLLNGAANVIPFGLSAGDTFSIRADIYTPSAHTSFASDSTSRQRRILVWYSTNSTDLIPVFGPQGANAIGQSTLSHTVTLPSNATGAIIAIGCAGSTTDSSFVTYVDSVAMTKTPSPVPYFDGNTQAPPVNVGSEFSGWFGGQGHTGCRMNGKPTRVLYTGVNGGQQGTAVTLVETGAWE